MSALEAGPLFGIGPPHALLVLLLAGHFLGDFLFQSGRMGEAKDRLPVLLWHGAIVTITHLALLVPFLSGPILAAGLAIGIVHTATDGAKIRWSGGSPGRLRLLLLDQAAHLAVIFAAWFVLRHGFASPRYLRIPEPWLGPLVVAAVLVAAIAFTWSGGSAIVRGVLEPLAIEPGGGRPGERSSGVQGGGHLIGGFERLLALILIVPGQWGALALLMTAKSIARFEELKKRPFAEYYLVGTLASLLIAFLVGLLLGTLLFGPELPLAR